MMLSNYLSNFLIDWLFRGQAAAPPATVYVALFTTAPTAAGGGIEVTGSGYARVGVSGSLANWAGTQGAGTTAVSSGTSGTTSNNAAITFPAPSGGWGSVVAAAIFDAATGGNMLVFGELTSAKTVNNGDPAPMFSAAQLSLTLT